MGNVPNTISDLQTYQVGKKNYMNLKRKYVK